LNNPSSIHEMIGETDIYLLDQIMKGRYEIQDTILDAGCGFGRNMHWFIKNNYAIYGINKNEEAISTLKAKYPSLPGERLLVSPVEQMPFANNYFNHIISSAVVHFANNTQQFYSMITEMLRLLKPKGSLFIRMTSDIGIEDKVHLLNDGVYSIPDGSKRFLLTRTIITSLLQENQLSFLESLKTVNVNDMRCMSTLVLQKN
jgi:tellurite methyltransferase